MGNYPFETTEVEGKIYNAHLLDVSARDLPVQEIATEQLAQAIDPTHSYWLDAEGNHFGPHHLLIDWNKAQKRERWKSHVENVKQADLANPIWIYRPTGQVINGVHRLTRAFLEHQPTIPVKYFDDLPIEALVS